MTNKTLFSLILVVVLDAIGFGIVFPLFPALFFDSQFEFLPQDTSQTIRGLWLGIMLSITPIVQVLVSPIAGSLSDRIGRRPCIVGCLSLGALGYIAAAFGVSYQSISILLIGRIFIGIAIASFAVVNACITDFSSSDEEKSRRFALINMGFGIGFIIGPVLGSFLAGNLFFDQENLSRPFLVNSILSLLNAYLAWAWLPETKLNITQKSSISIFGDLKTLSSVEKRLPMYFLVTFFFVFGWAFYISMIPVWWIQGLHVSSSNIAFILSGSTCVFVLSCSFLVGPLIRHFSPVKILSVALLCLAILVLSSLVYSNYFSSYCVLLPLQNIFGALLMPVAATIISDLSPRDHQGKAMGLLGSCEALGFGIAPVLGGLCLGTHLLLPTLVSASLIFSAFLIIKYRT